MTAAVAGGAGGALVVTCSILRSISRVGKGSKSVGGALVVILQWHGVVIPAHELQRGAWRGFVDAMGKVGGQVKMQVEPEPVEVGDGVPMGPGWPWGVDR